MMEFGMRMSRHSLLKQLNDGCQTNLVFSPLSFHLALNLLASSCTGKALEQLLRFLESESVTDLNAQSSLFMGLKSENPSSTGPVVSIVNAVWVDQIFSLKHSFKELAERVYEAKCESADFRNQREQVREEINSWARKASKGLIDPLVPSNFSSGKTRALLASALYFKGTWPNPFHASNTKDENFHLPSGEIVRVPFMKRYETFQFYGYFADFKLLKMGYRKGDLGNQKFAMYIFLPDKIDGLQELVQKFHSDPRYLLENRELEEVTLDELWLPKFKFAYECNAKETMKELGLDLPFNKKKAGITEMVELNASKKFYVSNAIQKSCIEVNEEGTTAAAITAFDESSDECADESCSEIDFIADHPFLFMIKEEVSGFILFVGAVLDPRAQCFEERLSRAAEKTKRKETKSKNRNPKRLCLEKTIQ